MTLEQEMETARKKYGAFHSSHEIYGVLQEEVDEFWDIVKQNTERTYGLPEYKSKKLIAELTQIAAIALRAAKELENNEVKFV